MITPAFLFALALLGNARADSQAGADTIDVEPNQVFEKTFEAGLQITSMQFIPKATEGETLQNRKPAQPVDVKNPCTGSKNAPADAKANCFVVSKLLFPVTVKAKMESTDRILTLKGEGNKELTVTFKP
ncbi:unnamed protein product [Dibothriocephalus latus]|uniref:Uncharacterized protein n=1 Tax=Dibothriocephalus latus TaxID=60516 RepID=A0A3P7P4E8_DIBLA|nr:unnamed protein product [Dibothriocephalus latus]